jgi:peptidoglycan/LPS O-acetylase OafA/YrhL
MLDKQNAASRYDARLTSLDLLRFFAALSVVFYHLTYSIDGQVLFPSLDPITRYGYLGVDLFFIISGFVILWSAQGKTPGEFVVSRFSRLYPLFWLAILITVIVLRLFGVEFGIVQLLKNATMLAGYLNASYIDGVYWTLQVELKFYFIIFLLLLIRRVERAEYWAYGWLCLALLNRFLGLIPGGLILAPYSSYFIAGMVLFQIWKSGLTHIRLIAFVVAFGLSALHVAEQVHDFVTGDVRPWIPVVLITIVHAVLFLIATRRIILNASSLWTWLGAATYPLYLLHNRIGTALFSAVLGESNVAALLITLLAIAVITAIATVIDNRMHRWVRSTLTRLLRLPARRRA